MKGLRYGEAIDYLYGLQRMGIKFGLENITRILDAIRNPHERLTVIHVAGSNGKGSTAAHLESVLMKAGYRVGLYTSPHLLSFNERIRIDRQEISEEEVVEFTNRVLDILPELRDAAAQDSPLPITFFEFTTAMAFDYFFRKDTDLAILEVGMGGRLDATNVCRPLVCVITSVSLEHQEYLGRTLVEIAGEKAGIVKRGVPVVLGVCHPKAREVVEEICLERGAPLFYAGREFKVHGTPECFSYHGIARSFQGLSTSLKGRHQIRNASLCLAALEILEKSGYPTGKEAVEKGLKDVLWSGRQEWYPGPPQILLDGAHNPEALRTLCSSLKRDYRFERLRVLMGVMREKDYRRMLKMLAPTAHEFVFGRPHMDRSLDPWVLQAEALRLGCRATVTEEIAQGFLDLMERAEDEDLICVTGSLFTVGEVLGWIKKNGLQPRGFLT